MSEYAMQTFGHHVLQFARTVDILPKSIYTEVLNTIGDYLRKELNAGFFSITTEASISGESALLGEWPDPKKPWWDELVKKDGKYTCQTALAHDKRKPLWIVGENGEKLDTTTNYKDLLDNVPPSDIPRYAKIREITARTSIILPLNEEGKHFGVMNVESKDCLQYMFPWYQELRNLADAISILRQLKKTHQFQIKNTLDAKLRLVHGDFVPVVGERNMFFAYSSRADKAVVGVINEVLNDYEKRQCFQVVEWADPVGGNIIDNIWKQISTCAFATCYFSELEEQQRSNRFRDNPNVLFEAGMLHALRQAKRNPLQGVLLVREADALTIPFDLSTERMVLVARSADGSLNEARFYNQLKEHLDTFLRPAV